MKKIINGIDFNVKTNQDEVKRGVNLISFTIDNDGKIWQSMNDPCTPAYSTDKYDKYAYNNVFKYIKHDELVSLVLGMQDKEVQAINDNVTVIRLYNYY